VEEVQRGVRGELQSAARLHEARAANRAHSTPAAAAAAVALATAKARYGYLVLLGLAAHLRQQRGHRLHGAHEALAQLPAALVLGLRPQVGRVEARLPVLGLRLGPVPLRPAVVHRGRRAAAAALRRPRQRAVRRRARGERFARGVTSGLPSAAVRPQPGDRIRSCVQAQAQAQG